MGIQDDSIFKSNLIGVFQRNDLGFLIEANNEFLRIIGYSRSELEAGIIPWFISNSQETRYEKFLKKDLSTILLKISESGLIGYVVEKTENNFRILAESIPQIVFEIAADFRTLFTNSKWKEYTGHDPEKDNWDELVHIEDVAQAKAAWEASMLNKVEFNVEYRLRHHSGSYRWFLVRAIPAPDGKNGIKWFGTLTDIDDQKMAEKTAAQMVALVESSIDAIISEDLNGTVTSWNSAAKNLFGFSADEMIGQSILRIFPHDRYHEESNILAKIKKGQIIQNLETIRVKKTGEPLHVNISVSPISDKLGRVVGISKIVRDITEFKKTEQELSNLRSQNETARLATESEQMFKKAFDYSPIGFFLLKSDDSWHECNSAFCEMLGYTREEIIKVPIRYLSPVDDRQNIVKARNDFFAGRRHELNIETTLIHKSGEPIPVWLTSSVIKDQSGHNRLLMTQVINMSERKQSEVILRETTRKLQALIDSSPAPILATDNNLTVTHWNPACERMFGWSAKEAIGQFMPFVPLEKRHESLKIVETALEGGKPIFVDVERVKKDGTRIQVHSGVLSTYDERGQVSGMIAVIIDVSERAKAEKDLKAASELAAAATRSKSEFLANMSHEIRTPINGVLGMTSLLLDTKLSSEQLEYAENIRLSADSLLSVVNDILDFSKVEAGKLDLEIIDFNLQQVLLDLIKPFEYPIAKKGLKLEVDLSKLKNNLVKGDPSRIRQVLINLIGNAVKFTDRGTIKIRVEQKNTYRFEVIDSGSGLSKQVAARMFQPFSQADTSTSRRFGGTGLGLSISKKLVGLMSGKIGVESTESKGSTFWFELDLEKSAITPQQKFEIRAPIFEGNGLRVLVAEDNAVNQTISVKMLEKLGCRADAVGNGREAVHALKKWPYDVVLMDCHMPELDGYEATRIIRQNDSFNPSLVIIAMTANALAGDKEKCLSCGMNDYISKPAKIDEVAQVLKRNIKTQTT